MTQGGQKNCGACGEVVNWETTTCIWKLGQISAILGLCCRLYGIILDMLLRHRQKQFKDTPPKRSPLWPSRRKQHFGPKFALGPVKVPGGYSYASWRDLEGKLGYRAAVFKLSWAILFGHVVAFASRNALPQQDQDLSGFLRAMLTPFEVKVRLSYGSVGAIWAPIATILVLCYRLFGIILDMLQRHRQKQLTHYLQNALPRGPRGVTEKLRKTNQKPKSSPKR